MSDAHSERHPVRRSGSGSGTTVDERRRGHFIQESWAELKKVEWPSQNQVLQGTVVVLIACLVVGSYLYVNDVVWKHVVQKVLLGQ